MCSGFANLRHLHGDELKGLFSSLVYASIAGFLLLAFRLGGEEAGSFILESLRFY